MRWASLIFLSAQAVSVAYAASPVPAVMTTQRADRPGITYAHAIIDPRVYRISVKAFSQSVLVASIPEKVACSGLAITGGFSKRSDNRLEPEGLVRTDMKEISSIVRWPHGGVISISEHTVRIARISSWRAQPAKMGMALQSKPLLVFEGNVDEPLNDVHRWNRVAVGTLRDGSVVFIGAFAPNNDAVTLREFAIDAKSILEDRLFALLNMDGGPSAFLYSKDLALLPAPGAITSYLCADAR